MKRQEILSQLISEFESSEKMFLAKAILDDFTCNIVDIDVRDKDTSWWLNQLILEDNQKAQDEKVFHECALKKALRYHKDPTKDKVTDEREIAVRASFDALIKFFRKLEYLHSIDLLKEKELKYFYYYYYLVAKNKDVQNYISAYGLALDFSISNLKPYKDYEKREENERNRIQLKKE